MDNLPKWYIQYDYKTFDILKDPKFGLLVFGVVQNFHSISGPDTFQFENEEEASLLQKQKVQTALALQEIISQLFNFLYVQCFMPKNSERMKTRLRKLCSVLKVQVQYCKYFLVMSAQFRLSRILASSIRLKTFMQCILQFLRDYRRQMDEKLLDNLADLQMYLKQKIQETLQITQSEGDHHLNIILIDILFLLFRNSGDVTLKPLLDNDTQKQIIDDILKLNQISNDFMSKKIIAKQTFEQNLNFTIDNPIQAEDHYKNQSQDD